MTTVNIISHGDKVYYRYLNAGECFLCDGSVFMKTEDHGRTVELCSGKIKYIANDEIVIHLDADITVMPRLSNSKTGN